MCAHGGRTNYEHIDAIIAFVNFDTTTTRYYFFFTISSLVVTAAA
jgi:hypothetical protein